MSSLKVLTAELAAIDQWDRLYWQKQKPEQCEKLAYLIRQYRRRDIMTELLNLMQASPMTTGLENLSK